MATTTKKVSITSTSDASLLKSTGFDNYTWTEAKTAGVNTFVVDKATKAGTLSLTGTGDTLKIDGYSGDFAASISGSKLTLTSGKQTINVTLATASKVNLSFTDGTKVVDNAAKTLGTQLLSKTAWPIVGQTAHEVEALAAAATAAAADKASAVAAAITSNDTTVISQAISTALTGTTFTSIADLLAAYNTFANPTFSVTPGAAAAEGASATFTVKLSAAQSTATSVGINWAPIASSTTTTADYSTTASITAGSGVTATNNVLNFPAGVTTATLSIPVSLDTITGEPGEGITLALTAVAGSKGVSTTAGSGNVLFVDVPTPATNAIAVNAAGSYAGTLSADTFNVTAGSYNATITSFAAGDKIVSPAGVVATLVQSDFGDGSIGLSYAANNQVAVITLTGLTPAQDAQIHSPEDLNILFSAGTFA
jgi:hypothetical protein